VKKDDTVGAKYRVSADEADDDIDNVEDNNSSDGTAAAAVGEERLHLC